MTRSELSELFWENSALSDATIAAWGAAMDDYAAAADAPPPALRYPGPDLPLHHPSDRGLGELRRRRSTRRFSDRPLSAKQLGAVLAAFASFDGGRRAYGSAGGTYPLEVFCLLNNVAGDAGGQVAYYNADNHSLTAVRPLAPWHDYAGAVNLDCGDSVPQLLVVFVLMPERVTEKYGERGGRFALMDVGAAAQTLALRLAGEGLAGCACGGLLDRAIKSLLGLDGTSAQIALGYACGVAARRRP
jgi:SagB-type dehydrogenase family enzyme